MRGFYSSVLGDYDDENEVKNRVVIEGHSFRYIDPLF